VKVLIFEYITASGEASKSLQREGQMMLDALLFNFAKLPNVEVKHIPPAPLQRGESQNSFLSSPPLKGKAAIAAGGCALEIDFKTQLKIVDAAWIIAPEFDGILESFCRDVENANKILLTSPSKAVALTANKLTTFQILHAAKIPTVPTEIFNPTKNYDVIKEWIIKPIDGVGAENTFLLTSENDWSALPLLEKNYLIQPHIHGEKTSLSCLFKNSEARLLCVNLQQFKIENQQYVLKNIEVNHKPDDGRYQKLASQIAQAFPDLFGYVGVDLIENEDTCFVLEINPRLTTSFVGIEKALGLNVAELVLAL
jgi:predicted ATP-grasp superfamily ATP-dependent carboligase